jgi:translation initiation factor eIF-2B subunit gamma
MEGNTQASRGEFQVVILAGGTGSRLHPFTPATPKHLLPVSNRPLLAYQLDMVTQAGFTEVLVVTSEQQEEAIAKFAREYSLSSEISIDLEVLDAECEGTADALRRVQHKIDRPFFVVSGDVISNTRFNDLADIHRASGATMTVMLQNSVSRERKNESASESKGGTSKKGKGKRKAAAAAMKVKKASRHDVCYVGLEMHETGSNRLVMYKSALDVEEDNELTISKGLLHRHPNVHISKNLRDYHVYLFSHWVLQLLEEKTNISSIQGELVPYLVRAQFSQQAREWTHVLDGNARAESAVVQSMTHATPSSTSSSSRLDHDNPVKCFALVALDTCYCVRVNSIEHLLAANRHVSSSAYAYQPWPVVADPALLDAAADKFPAAHINRNCVVGEDLQVGDAANLKRCVVGAHVHIGAGAKLMDCVLMDHAVVGANTTLTSCIVGYSGRVGDNVTLDDCQVAPRFAVPDATTGRKEHFFSDGLIDLV